ncbi:MAG: protein kinase, partial [Alphaproteobacteria bacterium]|nr:protein kinase [Alphaproteobacteria bacterium]
MSGRRKGANGRGPTASDTFQDAEGEVLSGGSDPSAHSSGSMGTPNPMSERPAARPPPALRLEDLSDPPVDRYRDLGLLGRGGVGEVRRMLDRTLQRKVAVKTLRREYSENPGMVARFIHEAQIVAQLQHPAIVPVYDLGRRDDGRWYISMSVIRGQDLEKVIHDFHTARQGEPLIGEYGGWSLRRLLEILRVICEAVGYAHSMGVVHRDLKPENVMVGEYGEVFVVDWGLAKVVDPDRRSARQSIVEEQQPEDWPELKPSQTRRGVIAGTPAYMSPEQARGEVEQITPRSDTWGLGGILYAILYNRMPYRGTSREVLKKVREGSPREPAFTRAPRPLVELWQRAMAMDPEKRFADGLEMAKEISAYIEGSRAREMGRAMLNEATALRAELETARQEAARLGQRARASLVTLRATDKLADKEAAWTMEEEAQAALDRVEQLYREIAAKARAALIHAPELPAAHRFLAALYRERAESAEAKGDARGAQEFVDLLREHDDGTHREFLQAEGALSLSAEPPEA